jgi:hypothetical protein
MAVFFYAPAKDTANVINPDYLINRLVIGVWREAEREPRKGDKTARQWLYIVLNIHPD